MDGSSGKRRWYVDYRGLGTGSLFGRLNRFENGETQMCLSSLARRDTTNQVGSIVQSLLTVESSLGEK